MRNRFGGMTLIELMITLVIVAIIASFAIPSYMQHAQAARRTDGQSALMDLYARMERYYANNNTYVGATIGDGGANEVLSRPASEEDPACPVNTAPSPEQYYCLRISASSATAFTLQAAPRTGGPQAGDTDCATLSITSAQVKGQTGSAGTDVCWKR